MPFDAQAEQRRIDRTLRLISSIRDEMGDDEVTLDEADEEAVHCREEAEWLWDDVRALRDKDELSRSEKAALMGYEKEMERLDSRSEELRENLHRLESLTTVDPSRPLDEVTSDLRDERRRLQRYVAA